MTSSVAGPSGGVLRGTSCSKSALDGPIYLNVTVGRAEIGSEIPRHAAVLCAAAKRNISDAPF